MKSLCQHSDHPTALNIMRTYPWSFSENFYCISLLILLIIPELGVGQAVVYQEISGTLVKSGSQQPLAYATIRVAGQPYGAVSNVQGEFALRIPVAELDESSQLLISAIGYANARISLSEWNFDQSPTIKMEEKSLQLSEVFIYGSNLDAAEMVRAAFDRIPENYPENPFLLNTFYRHYCKEGDEYGRLIEAAIDLYEPKGYQRQAKRARSSIQVRLRQLRRTYDFTNFSARAHAPIAVYMTLDQDFARYKNVLSEHLGEGKFVYQYSDTTFFDEQIVYVIKGKGKIKGVRYDTDLYISAATLAIVKIREKSMLYAQNAERKLVRTSDNLITYQAFEGRYYPNHLINEGILTTTFLDSMGQIIHEEDHLHHVEIMTNQIHPERPAAFKGKEPDQIALLQMKYDPAFWSHYNVLKATPLERGIEEDLAARMPLELQFQNVNRQASDPDFNDRLQTAAFDRILSHNQGKLIFAYFWRSDKLPRLKDLLLVRKLVRKYNDQPVALIFVSFDESEESWRKTLRKWGMSAGNHLRLAKGNGGMLAKRFGIKSVPYYLIFDRSGNIALQADKLPANAELKREIERIMDL